MALDLDAPPAAMTWWKSPPSSSYVSPKSGADSPSKGRRAAGMRDIGLFRSRREQPQPRRGGQLRRRRAGDLEVAPAAGFPGFGGGARSPAVEGEATAPDVAESSPLPLPVPDLASLLRWEPGIVEGRGRLLSPKELAGSDYGDGKEKLSGSSSGSNFTSLLTRKRPEHVNESSPDSASANDLKTLLERRTAEEVESNIINVPARSAPSSKLSSPVQSPRRMSTGDFLSSSSAVSHGIRFWSSPEIPVSDVTETAFHSLASPDKLSGFDQDWSPLHSPTWNSVISKSGNPSGETAHVNSNRSLESSSWPDQGLVAVHPLPLPPRAPLSSLSTFLPHSSPVLEVPPMKWQWQKGKLIGRGTFGNVYVATNKETGALCAMKEVNLIPDDPKSVESMMQLEQEIKVLSQLKHPNIVQYYGSEIVEDRFYIYLEYVHPGSISKYVREHCGAMTESVVRNFTRHILTGLAYLHSKKTIHRDIKGANLLVDASGVVKLADFGMAKHLSGQAAALSLRGSPYWMAPEVMQAMMQKDAGYDLAVDIWSLGCTIIEMFTGKPPWNEYEGAAAMFKVLKNESPPIPANLSAEGKDFLQLCFLRNPSDRPSASVLLEHRFVRNFSQIQETSGYINEFSRMQLMDSVVPSTEWNSSYQTGKGRPIPNW